MNVHLSKHVEEEMKTTRRTFLAKLGIGAVATAGLVTANSPVRASSVCQRVNGSGSYKLGPFDAAKAGDDPVYLITDLGFDESMVFCKVTTNFAAFRFPTKRIGVIEIGAHSFAMEMESVSMDRPKIED